MVTDFSPSPRIREIRKAISHPVVDSDGHILELLPLVHEIAQELSDLHSADAMMEPLCRRSARVRSASVDDRRSSGIWRGSWWGAPAENTIDRATTTLPRLFHRRLDQFGIDFEFVFPTLGLLVFLIEDEDIRRLMARSFNTYYARMFNEVLDRVEPAAVIPMHTPEEAVAELRHAVEVLGLRTVVMTGVVPRRVKGGGVPGATWVDTVAYGSDYDYDTVWAECERLRVVPTFHGTGMGWGARSSPVNYVYNHLGNFSAANEACCRAIVLGGAAQRFPKLSWSFLEGGVSWAMQLQADLIGHFEKRNQESILQYDPRRVEWPLMSKFYTQYRSEGMPATEDVFASWTPYLSDPDDGRPLLDDFADSGLDTTADIARLFQRFYFGCEPDDRLVPMAFDGRFNCGGIKSKPMFASDIGHWDVPDACQVLPELWDTCTRLDVDEGDFESLTFANVVDCVTRVNPKFFDRTVIGAPARRVSAEEGQKFGVSDGEDRPWR
ncbi:amidohydrolase family protein [Amycolatopsis magusensis]|uniref:amidohydrolase family protein n=1 Tax=Amycolatopsis magusensis TaxID=882444 RepID=UPI0024A9BC2F|nr:amidohydrolase family protein [Amycolatopsis magusensis]MDI5982533.1 amidohydrolase family protein [Amycolatopsis magusensis]